MQLVAGHGARVGAHQQLQDAQLRGGQLEIVLGNFGAARAQVEAQRSPLDQRLSAAPPSPGVRRSTARIRATSSRGLKGLAR